MLVTNTKTFGYLYRGREGIFTRTSFFAFLTVILLFTLATYTHLTLFPSAQSSALTTVPTKMNFQGRLTDSTGNIKPNGTYNMQLRLYTASSGGSAVWTENRLVSATQGVTLTNGLFAIQLGDITSLPASLFASGPLYLEIQLPTPATATSASPVWTEPAMSPRNQLATSAYAYNAETLDGLDSDYLRDASNLNAGTVSGARLSGSYTGITGTGALAAGSIASGFGTISTANTIATTSTLQGSRLISTVATGTAPLTVTSTTVVTNLNSDLLDGQSGAFYQSATNLNAGTIASARVAGSYTGITGTGALAAGSIASGFGTIATGNTISGTQLSSTVATGTAPLTVASTTKVTNLNVDLLDGLDSTQFIRSDAADDKSGRLRVLEGSIGNAYNQAPIEIQDSWDAGTGPSPRISFHYSGAIASQIGFLQGDNSGDISILNNPGTGYETLRVASLKVGTTTVIDGSRNLTNIGTISSSGSLTIGGSTVCTSSGCTPTGGAGASLSGNNTFTGVNTFQNAVNITGNVSTGSILTVGQTANQQVVIGGGATNHSIELGRTDGTASTPFIDFHSSTSSTDRSSRIIASGGTGTAGSGTLEVEAANFYVSGKVFTPGLTSGNPSGNVCRDSSTGELRYASGSCGGSSIRYKENVTSLDNALGIISQLRPVSYDYRTSSGLHATNGGKSDFGLIAEELDRVLPELVEHDGAGNIIGLDYEGLIPFALRAIQQQQSQIGVLQNTANIVNGGTINGSLAVTNNLNVGGHTTLTDLTVSGAASFEGNLVVTGAAEFKGTLTVQGHIISKGNKPTIEPGQALGMSTQQAVVDGTDSAGTLTLTAGSGQIAGGIIARITFSKAFETSYKATLSAMNADATDLRVYLVKTATGFDVVTKDVPEAGKQYQFDYIIIGAANE